MTKAVLKFTALLALFAPTIARSAPPAAEQYGPPPPPVNLALEITTLQREATALHAKAQEIEASLNNQKHRTGGSRVVSAEQLGSDSPQDAKRSDSGSEQ